MEFLFLIGGIIILILVFNLRDRIQKLEQLLQSGAIRSTSEPNYPTQASQIGSQQPMPSVQVVQTLPSGSSLYDQFVNWLKEDWLLKLGVLLLLMGFGWLVTYAFLNNWIGPMGRIALGLGAGVLFLLLGWWRIMKYLHQGGTFLVLGSTIILVTIFAAREIYNFFTPTSALVVMFLSTAFVALASVKNNSRSLALASLILAGIAPLLTNSPTANHIGLFSYLFVVTFGAIWIVLLTGQRELTTAALILIVFYSLPHLFFGLKDTGTLLLFTYAFAALFFITNTAGILKLKDKEIVPDLVTAAGNGLFLLAWIVIAAPDEWKSLIISAWMMVFAVGAFLLFKITQRREPFYVYAGVGIAMLAAATSAELKGATLIIAYTIESGLISLITYFILRDIRIAERISMLLVGSIILSFSSIVSEAWMVGVLHKDFFVLLILGLTLFGLGLFYLPRITVLKVEEASQFNAILLIAGSIYAYVLLWLSLHASLINDSFAVMISLVVYTITGLITYFYGKMNDRKWLRLYGAVLIGFVVARLFIVDIWKMELTGRIITFFLVGALLVSTAFISQKKPVTLS